MGKRHWLVSLPLGVALGIWFHYSRPYGVIIEIVGTVIVYLLIFTIFPPKKG